jgi:hypothetical protein
VEIMMSNTYKHKSKAKFNKGILLYKDTCESFRRMCDRWNYGSGLDRKAKRVMIEKITKKLEME